MKSITLYTKYTNSFKGLRKEVWWLALITLINRAGTMVIPFLSLYLTADLGFSLKQVGWIMSAFGLGSVAGAWLGGKLADKWGFYPVITWSFGISGIMFVLLQYIHSFTGLCMGIFILMVVADSLRPAVYVALNTYSKPENRTRSVTLIRLAINLGFSAGPAAGGFIIAALSYGGLFWVDGITCIIAGILFVILLDKRKTQHETEKQKIKNHRISPYHDRIYLLFIFIVFIIGFAFLQLFSTFPLYCRDIHSLSEKYIGLLMAMNGLLIFVLEMPLVKYIEHSKIQLFGIIITSTSLIGLSFITLNISSWQGVVVIAMLFITFGEMSNFPFLNRFALDRAERGKSGEYMALFTIAFSSAHVFGHNSGMQLVDKFGFKLMWFIMAGVLFIAVILFIWLSTLLKKDVH